MKLQRDLARMGLHIHPNITGLPSAVELDLARMGLGPSRPVRSPILRVSGLDDAVARERMRHVSPPDPPAVSSEKTLTARA